MSGIDLIERVGAAHPEVRMLVLSGQDGGPVLFPLHAGGRARLRGQAPEPGRTDQRRTQPAGRLLGVSAARARGGPPQGYATGRDALTLLTEREVTVLQYLARGYSNKDIARELLISSKTVSTHKVNIMEKLHIASLIELADFARHHNPLR